MGSPTLIQKADRGPPKKSLSMRPAQPMAEQTWRCGLECLVGSLNPTAAETSCAPPLNFP
jgi:hypothetical protein